tara:strand:- start:103 stop:1152 length:1050 start_codon:yes stop_codon:yes gene_type:complete
MNTWLNYLLFPFSVLYRFSILFRNFCYDKNLLKTNQLPCNVISIGNISFGGTGKTPTVLYLCKMLQENKKKNIAILSRGYKRSTSGTVLVSSGNGPLKNWQAVGDESYMMAQKTKNIPIVVDSNRYRGGKYLIKNFNSKIIILDDGFQHRALSRNLDIVLINGYTKPSDYSFLTTNLIRETWISLKRADTIIFTKKNPNPLILKNIKAKKLMYINSTFKSSILYPKGFDKKNKALLLSGIGNPKSFEKLARSHGCIIVGIKRFKDHYSYNKKSLLKIVQLAKNLKADYILTTEKDWVKIEPIKPNFLFVVLKIELNLFEKEKMKNILKAQLNLNLSHSPCKNDTNKSQH